MKRTTTARPARTLDMTEGPIMGRMLIFALPMIATGILQLLYNAFDMIIVGRYDSNTGLAAVGATSPVINLIIGVFIGVSMGAGIVVAQYTGAHRDEDVSQTVHTSMLVAVISGVALCIVGVIAARPMMALIETPDDVIDQAALYMRIFVLGVPASMVYNFGASILRAVGDSRRPLYFLALSGVVNVILNYIFVRWLHMGVAGVAAATDISQVMSAVLVLLSLTSCEGSHRLYLRRLRIYPDKLWHILRIGVPSGLQSSLFSVSNVLIQSSVNSFGAITMAGHTAALSIEGFINAAASGVSQAGVTFAGQNIGAGKPRRIRRIAVTCAFLALCVTTLIGVIIWFFGESLLGIYSEDAAVVSIGMIRLRMSALTFGLWALMEVYSGQLRGMGHSTAPMLISIAGICLMRVVWIYTVFPLKPTLLCLYLSYPVSWGITFLAHFVCFCVVLRRTIRRQDAAALG